MKRARWAGVLGVLTALWLGCEQLPADLGGQDVAEPLQFTGPQPRWIEWSPQSDAIVYELGGRLIIGRGEDLKDAVQITGTGRYSYPSWSPDGLWIVHAYRADRFRQDDLWIRSADMESVPRRLTDSAARDYAPKWSADGRWIAFHSTRSPGGHVWIVPAEGGEPKPLARAWFHENSLDWSPKAPLLAFEGGESIDGGIWIGNPETGKAWEVVNSPASERSPRWRPDGKAIGFLRLSGGWNVWVADATPGAAARQLTTLGQVTTFDWIANGRAVLFLTEDGTLYAQKDEPNAQPVPIRHNVANFRASPDGRRYVYVQRIDTYFRYYADRVPEPFLP